MVMDTQAQGVSPEHHRVLGQLVLALRESGLLVGARDVDYQVRDGGIVVEWIAGAHAHEVADGLAAYGAAGWLDINAIAPSPRPHARLLIGGLAVTLAAYQPVGLAHARATAKPRFQEPDPVWPDPLLHEGACKDTVYWVHDPREGWIATVLSVPLGLTHSSGAEWTEDGHIVALPEQDSPEGLWPGRGTVIALARQICSVMLRPVSREVSMAQADDWMSAALTNPHALPKSVAVVWRDRCVMRRRNGLVVTAVDTGRFRQGGVPWRVVPSAVLAPAWHGQRELPDVITVRALGHCYQVGEVALTASIATPVP